MDLGLTICFCHVGLNALDVGFVRAQGMVAARKSPNERLIQQIFFVGIRGNQTLFNFDFMFRVQTLPMCQSAVPLFRHFRQHIDPRPDIFTALGVMRREGRQAAG